MASAQPLKGKKRSAGAKVTRQNDKCVAKTKMAKSAFQSRYIEKYPDLGAVHEAELRQFVSTVAIARLRAYGGRFHALMEALEAARQQPSAQTRQAVIRLIADLEKESRNRRYRQILQALAAAVRSKNGLNRAFWTVLRIVEMTFEWTNEYMFAFNLYTQYLAQDRRHRHKR
jgi:hypothetical protein